MITTAVLDEEIDNCEAELNMLINRSHKLTTALYDGDDGHSRIRIQTPGGQFHKLNKMVWTVKASKAITQAMLNTLDSFPLVNARTTTLDADQYDTLKLVIFDVSKQLAFLGIKYPQLYPQTTLVTDVLDSYACNRDRSVDTYVAMLEKIGKRLSTTKDLPPELTELGQDIVKINK